MKDNCTFFLEGWWGDCCKAHDIAYETQVDKSTADKELFNCIKDSGYAFPSLLIAACVFAAVSVFGKRWYSKVRVK